MLSRPFIHSSEGCRVRKHVGMAEFFFTDAWRGVKPKSTLHGVFPPIKCSLSVQNLTLSHYFTKVLTTIQDRCAGCLQLGTSLLLIQGFTRLVGRNTQGLALLGKTFYAHPPILPWQMNIYWDKVPNRSLWPSEVFWQCYEFACKTKEEHSTSNLKFVIRNCVVSESSLIAIWQAARMSTERL